MFEIGNSLREARLRQALEYPEVEQAIKVRGKYLRALEDEQFDVLPAQTYVKGFLRAYAEYLGLDGQLYVDEYNSRYGSVDADEPIRARRSVPRTSQQRRLESRIVVLTLLGIALVTALVFAAWKFGGTTNEALPTVVTPAPAGPRVQHAPLLVVAAPRGSSHLTIRRGGPTGAVVWDGTLDRGETQSFEGKRLWVEADSPELLRLTVNGFQVRRRHGPLRAIVTRSGIRPAGA